MQNVFRKLIMKATAITIVALTLFGEGAGESMIGKRLVASTIWARAGGNAERLAAVCKERRQFSCWNNGKTPTVPDDEPSRRTWCDCVETSVEMFNGTFTPVMRVTHYHTTDVNPRWNRKMKQIGRWGRHDFWYDKKYKAKGVK
jgi:spore germination cell wall hydrolase CwlJ-like protein